MTAVTALPAMLVIISCASAAGEPPDLTGPPVTLKGSMVCNGACLSEPKPDDHVMVVFAIEGTSEIVTEVAKIMAEFYPDKGLDADAARKLLDQFSARLKFFISPDSLALKDPEYTRPNHYCQGAASAAVTGVVSKKNGKRWITASRIEPTSLKYPDKMLAPDKPFVIPDKKPLILKVTDSLTLKCVPIPPGKFLMGTPFYTWPYFQEEYPHLVTLTKLYYMSEIPITQDMYEAIMGKNPSTAKGPRIPVQDPPFADVERFCQRLSEKAGRKVRLPSDAEWEYGARVGTSNPGFREKYKAQDSSGHKGFKIVLPVKSKQPNAWGLYDMVSCWWEITGDRGMYNVRHSEVDPHYPPRKPETTRSQRNGRGLLKKGWSIVTHEFITEKGYAGQKFRVVVEAEE